MKFTKKKIQVILLIIFLFLINSSYAMAVTLNCYVDASYSGSTEPAGSFSSPYRSISDALIWAQNQVNQDDLVIHIKAGNYSTGASEPDNEHLLSNYYANSITIKGDEKGGAVLSRSGAASWVNGLTISAPVVTIKNLEITGFEIGISIITPESGNIRSYMIKENRIQNVTTGINVEAHSNDVYAAIDSNRIGNITTGISVSSSNFKITAKILNNVIYNLVGRTGVNAVSINNMSTSGGAIDVGVYFNTIDSGENGEATGILLSADNSLAPFTAEISFNNITNFTKAGSGIDTSNTTIVKYNNFWNTNRELPFLNSTLSDNLDPPLNPLYGADYNITSASPCVDIIPLSALPADMQEKVQQNSLDDIQGTTRQRASAEGAPENSDIGAYEYSHISYNYRMPEKIIGGKTDYRIHSIPVDFEGGNLKEAFEKNYGFYDPTIWRIFGYDSLNGKYIEFSSSAFNLYAKRGMAFWAICTEPAFSLQPALFKGRLTGNTKPFTMELTAGWHLIALPWPKGSDFHFVSLGEIKISGGDMVYQLISQEQTMAERGIWFYDPGNQDAAENGYVLHTIPDYRLETGAGYWIKVNDPMVKITIPPFVTRLQEPQAMGKQNSSQEKSLSESEPESPPAPPSASDHHVESSGGCFMGTIVKE